MGSQERINVPIWISVVFKQRIRQGSRNLKNDTFYRPLVKSAQCFIGTEKSPVNSILKGFDEVEDFHSYVQSKESFTTLTKHDILKSYISDHDFRSTKVDVMLLVKLQMILVIIYTFSTYNMRKI